MTREQKIALMENRLTVIENKGKTTENLLKKLRRTIRNEKNKVK